MEALNNSTTRTVRCLVCEAPINVAVEAIDDAGTAGKSAHLEYQRRHLARQARVKGLLGNMLGNVVLAITDDPHMGWQIQAVQLALDALGLQPKPPVIAVLCLVDAEWPILFPPEEYKGVQLAGNRKITKLVAGEPILEPELMAAYTMPWP